MDRALRRAIRRGWLPGLAACLLLGCAGIARLTASPYSYFQRPAPDDPWSAKITRWQERERATGGAELLTSAPSMVGSGPGATARGGEELLRTKYLRFRAEHKRALARELAAWLQEQSKIYYVPDGAVDRWATLEETLDHNGDDCDGLELLAFHLLLDMGFHHDEVYRAIVFRPADGQHHMVTLWFEDPHDPWVLDPTGAMTTGMPHMSEVPGWIPLKVFSETEEYTVHTSPGARAAAVSVPVPDPAPH